MTGRTDSSGSDLFVHSDLAQLSKETDVSVWMRSKGAEQLSKSLGDDIERSSLAFSLVVAAKRVKGPTTDSDDLLLRLSNFDKVEGNF